MSSARVVRCWVKSRKERNPCCQLPASKVGDSGETAGDNSEEGGDDVKSSCPLCLGPVSYTHLDVYKRQGSSTIIAIFMAQKKKREADELLSQNLTVLIIMGVVITAAVLIFTEPIARLLGANDVTLDYTVDYLKGLSLIHI